MIIKMIKIDIIQGFMGRIEDFYSEKLVISDKYIMYEKIWDINKRNTRKDESIDYNECHTDKVDVRWTIMNFHEEIFLALKEVLNKVRNIPYINCCEGNYAHITFYYKTGKREKIKNMVQSYKEVFDELKTKLKEILPKEINIPGFLD